MTAFKKGEQVVVISNFDRKGTFSFTHAVVESCGKKQMTLVNAKTGKMLGRHFTPVVAASGTGIYKAMAEHEIRQICIAGAETFLSEERARMQRNIERYCDQPGYVKANERNLSELHAADCVEW